MNGFYFVLALSGGIALATQVAINSHLKTHIGTPMQATLVSFCVGITAAFGYCLIAGYSWPKITELGNVPWWAWTGGLLGVFYLGTSVAAAPKLGVAATLGLVIVGQVATSMVLDHFGLLGVPVRSASLQRIFGVLLVLTGVIFLATAK